jgi:tryptophan-rich sensory protein
MKKEERTTNKESSKIDYKILAIAIISVFLTAFIGSSFTGNETNSEWYTKNKPTITPPNIVFPIVWNILFIMIAISMYLALKKADDRLEQTLIFVAYFSNFILNILWSTFFFGLKNPGLAFIDMIFLWLSIGTLILATGKISKTSSLLLIPYFLWVTFASILNYSFIF